MQFFFEQFFINLAKDKDNKYFFKPPKPKPKGGKIEDIKAWATAMDRAKQENNIVYKRSGYRGMYRRVLKSDNYSSKREKEVINSNFADVIRMISLENATIT